MPDESTSAAKVRVPRQVRALLAVLPFLVSVTAIVMGVTWWEPGRLRWALPALAIVGVIGGTVSGYHGGQWAVWEHLKGDADAE